MQIRNVNNLVCTARWQDAAPLFAITTNTIWVSLMPQTGTKRRENNTHPTRYRWKLRTVLKDQ